MYHMYSQEVVKGANGILFYFCIRHLGLYFISKFRMENHVILGDFRPLKLVFF